MDEILLQSILIEVQVGLTFAKSASLAYQDVHNVHGDSATAKAVKALESAKRFMLRLDPAGQQIVLAQLPKLERAIAGIIRK